MDPCEFLTWDSEFFGRRIARMRAEVRCDNDFATTLAWCERERIDCLYLLVEADDLQNLSSASEHGFRLVDVRVTLERRLGISAMNDHPPNKRPTGWRMRPFQATDLPALEALAAGCFRQTRFYADPNFVGPARERLYPTWMRRSCEELAAQVFVAEADGRPIGAITCERGGGKVGQIGLFAVDPGFRGAGVGAGLVDAALRWFADETLNETVRVVTQGANIAAQRTYQKAQFLACRTQFWWHRWFNTASCHAGQQE